MRLRYIVPLLGALVCLLVIAAPVSGDHGDAGRKSCTDITAGSGTYDGSTVAFILETAGPTCKGSVYTLHVLQIFCNLSASLPFGDCFAAEPLTTQALGGNKTASLSFSVDASAASGDHVCVYATSGTKSRVLDRAPDSGCMVRGPGPYDCVFLCDACSDIVRGTESSAGGVSFPAYITASAATPTCPEVIYTLELFKREDSGDLTLVDSESLPGNGTSTIAFSLPINPAPGETLLVRAKSSAGGHVYDEVDPGCEWSQGGPGCGFIRFH